MAKKTRQPTMKGRRRVAFEFQSEPDSEVFVAGSFNHWRPDQKKLKASSAPGLFRANLYLPRGTYEYKFVVNGTWHIDPQCGNWVPNEYGSLNSVIEVV